MADKKYDQIVMGEVLIPNTPNCYGDIYTEDAIREFCHRFMVVGLNSGVINDLEHDHVDLGSKVFVIESFIARDGDKQFIPGSWVIAMWINDAGLWQQVLDGDINGFSYEALVGMTPVTIENLQPRVITGITSPDPFDDHTHAYVVKLDALNRPIGGSVSETDGHTHAIVGHTVTGITLGHKHRFNVIQTEGESNAI